MMNDPSAVINILALSIALASLLIAIISLVHAHRTRKMAQLDILYADLVVILSRMRNYLLSLESGDNKALELDHSYDPLVIDLLTNAFLIKVQGESNAFKLKRIEEATCIYKGSWGERLCLLTVDYGRVYRVKGRIINRKRVLQRMIADCDKLAKEFCSLL